MSLLRSLSKRLFLSSLFEVDFSTNNFTEQSPLIEHAWAKFIAVWVLSFNSFCCCLVTKLCPTLFDPMDCNMLGSTVLHYLLEFAQIHVHWVGNAIWPSHPLPPPAFAFNISQQHGLFQWVDSASGGWSIGASASVLPMNVQSWFPLGLIGLISLQSRGLSGVFSSTIIWRHQFFCPQPSLWSNSHIHTWLLERTWLWLYWPLSTKWCFCLLIHCLGLL